MTAYVIGEFVNSYIITRLKVWTKGRYLPFRMVVSTIFGAGADTIIVIVIAWLKREERRDHFDHDTNFNPFTLSM